MRASSAAGQQALQRERALQPEQRWQVPRKAPARPRLPLQLPWLRIPGRAPHPLQPERWRQRPAPVLRLERAQAELAQLEQVQAQEQLQAARRQLQAAVERPQLEPAQLEPAQLVQAQVARPQQGPVLVVAQRPVAPVLVLVQLEPELELA